jgi:hypothetical protein
VRKKVIATAGAVVVAVLAGAVVVLAMSGGEESKSPSGEAPRISATVTAAPTAANTGPISGGVATAVVAATSLPVGQPTPTPETDAGPCTPAPGRVTINDNNKTVDMRTGGTFLLCLGDSLIWNVSAPDDTNVVSRVPNVAVVRGAQGIYKANRPGQTTLKAVGDLPCRQSQPPCQAPSMLFQVTVVVDP